MVDQIKKIIGSDSEKGIPAPEQRAHFETEGALAPEKKEVNPDEKIVAEELKREIELMQMDEDAKKDVEKTKQKIEYLGEKEKIEHLLAIARDKGVVFAVQVAKRTNDPYLLDLLHDVLAREGYYQKLMQSISDDDNDDDNSV